MMRLSTCALLICVAIAASGVPVQAQLRGHGGPVKSLAISADGSFVLSGSFDSSAIRWSLSKNTAEQVLRFHESAVNAVAVIAGGKLATAGEDAQVAIWDDGKLAPTTVLKGHTAPVAALAASPDGKWIASASWDRSIRLAPVAGGEAQVLTGHQDNVNGLAFTPDGSALVSAADRNLAESAQHRRDCPRWRNRRRGCGRQGLFSLRVRRVARLRRSRSDADYLDCRFAGR
jgi:cytochrome c